MFNEIRWREYALLLYRLFLVYIFYFIARFLFYIFNNDILNVASWKEFFRLSYYGIAFDTTGILYINSLFLLISVLPLFINTRKSFQKILFFIYFITNGIAYALNFIDIAYYRFSKARLTSAVQDVIANEKNYGKLLVQFFKNYWYLLFLFILLLILWMFLYERIHTLRKPIKKKIPYLFFSIIGVLIAATLSIGGIRGGFMHSTRPINMIDANRHVKIPDHADLVLNSTFSFFRTLGKADGFKKVSWVSKKYIEEHIKPIKHYTREVDTPPNVVLFIIESFGREYWGAMNQNTTIANFKSYTPFLDSLAKSSYIFDNAHANGRQSIHGMSSILAGIPSFKTAFTSSPYGKQKIESLISVCNSMNYTTSFFHGAPNGSMGFLGFSNILGFDNYYGKKEYNNDGDFDGIWGIWDEPFLQFMSEELSKKQQPFLGTVFTVSSHHPYKVPEKHKDKFAEGAIPIHKCIEYTDYSIQQFFEAAKKTDWFENTIFVFTADHTNQTYYDEYKASVNSSAIPIMFYSPKNKLVPSGKSSELAQHIDIYPSIIDLIGYNKPFRSWGRSLFSKKADETPRIINSNGTGVYRLMQGEYIYIFNGESILGIYKNTDLMLSTNLLGKNLNANEVQKATQDLKAFIQDYTDRIVDRKLHP